MARITLKETAFDGEYEFDFDQTYSGHELHLIKKLAGLRLGEIQEAAKAGDYDLFVAFAVIALWRAGKVAKDRTLEAADVLLDAPAGSIAFEDDQVADARPPEHTQTGPVGSEKPDENSTSSSGSSNSTGDTLPETIPASTGPPG